jgi:hypothetical protein
MDEWTPEEIAAHMNYYEVLAGFQVVDVASEARALEIAARVSAVPGPGGVPIQQPVEARQVMGESRDEL